MFTKRFQKWPLAEREAVLNALEQAGKLRRVRRMPVGRGRPATVLRWLGAEPGAQGQEAA